MEIPAGPGPQDSGAIRALRRALAGRRVDVVHAHGLRAGFVAALARPPRAARGDLAQRGPREGSARAGVAAGRADRRPRRHASPSAPPRTWSPGPRRRRAASPARCGGRAGDGRAEAHPRRGPRRVPARAGHAADPVGRPAAPAEALRPAGRRGRPVARPRPRPGRRGRRLRARYMPLAQRASARHAPGARCSGTARDVPDLLAGADLAVVTSDWEARQLFAQEALRAGVPLVATAVGGLPGLVGDAAVLIPPGDVDALDAAVRRLLDRPGAYARTTPPAARDGRRLAHRGRHRRRRAGRLRRGDRGGPPEDPTAVLRRSPGPPGPPPGIRRARRLAAVPAGGAGHGGQPGRLAVRPATGRHRSTADYVVVAGAAGLRWDDLDPQRTPALWAAASRGLGGLAVGAARRTHHLPGRRLADPGRRQLRGRQHRRPSRGDARRSPRDSNARTASAPTSASKRGSCATTRTAALRRGAGRAGRVGALHRRGRPRRRRRGGPPVRPGRPVRGRAARRLRRVAVLLRAAASSTSAPSPARARPGRPPGPRRRHPGPGARRPPGQLAGDGRRASPTPTRRRGCTSRSPRAPAGTVAG